MHFLKLYVWFTKTKSKKEKFTTIFKEYLVIVTLKMEQKAVHLSIL
jgi:hypothetical protein